MSKIYDPILCMMVEPGTTAATRDAFTCMTHDGFDIKNVRDHYEVYKDGKLVGSADNMAEVKEIIQEEDAAGKKTNDGTFDMAQKKAEELLKAGQKDMYITEFLIRTYNLTRNDANKVLGNAKLSTGIFAKDSARALDKAIRMLDAS